MKKTQIAFHSSCEIVKKNADIEERSPKLDKMCELESIIQK